MPAQKIVQAPVRMGSNKFNLELIVSNENECSIRCAKFIEMVLRKCNLSGSQNLSRTYSMFESSCGVERLLGRNEDIIQLLRQNQDAKLEFVIRKCGAIEQNLTVNTSCKQNVRKCYKKLNQMKQIDQHLSTQLKQNNDSVVHLYESIDKTTLQVRDDDAEQVESRLPLAQEKDEEEEEEHFNKMKLENNINLLRYLYSKLRVHNALKAKFSQQSSDSKVALLAKNYDNSCDCSNSSSDNESSSSSDKFSRSSSSSALESLV